MLFFCLISLCWFVKIGPVASEKAEDLWMFSEMKTSSLHCSRSLWFPLFFFLFLSLSLSKTLASSEAQLINEANQFCQSVGPLSSKVHSALKLVKLSEILFHPQINCKKLQFDEMPVEWGKFSKTLIFFHPNRHLFKSNSRKNITYTISPLLEHWTRGAFISSKLFL